MDRLFLIFGTTPATNHQESPVSEVEDVVEEVDEDSGASDGDNDEEKDNIQMANRTDDHTTASDTSSATNNKKHKTEYDSTTQQDLSLYSTASPNNNGSRSEAVAVCSVISFGLCYTVLVVCLILILPSVALFYAYDWENNQDEEELFPNDACDDAANWMTILAWFQIASLGYVILLQLWACCQLLSQQGQNEVPASLAICACFHALLYPLCVAFQLGWVIYGAVILTRNRGEYSGTIDGEGDEDMRSCDSLALYAQVYCWITLAGILCDCQRKKSEDAE